MKQTLLCGLLTAAGALAAVGATAPIFINEAPISVPPETLPTVNATSFVNRSVFTVSPGGFFFQTAPGEPSFFIPGRTPYETFNTGFYTNTSSGIMSGFPGFRLQTTRGRKRIPAAWLVNDGYIFGSTYLEIKATNIVNTGFLETGPTGLIRIQGKDVSVVRNGVRTGNTPGVSFFGGGNLDFNRSYNNAPGITDEYWGVGSNNVLNPPGSAVRLNTANPNFNLPDPQFGFPPPRAPTHQAQSLIGRRLFTNTVFLPKFNFSGYQAFAYTNTLGGTATVVQVVFVPVENFNSNLTTQVRFYNADPLGEGPATVAIEFNESEYDIARDTTISNPLYLLDDSATVTNFTLYRNLAGGNRRRPNVYQVFRSAPFEFFFGEGGNTTFTNGMLWNPNHGTNRVIMTYAAYSASFTSAGLSNTVVAATFNAPTNLPGRVEIFGDKLDLDSLRVRAESTIVIKTKDLASNRVARVDAPFLSFDLTSKQPELIITNLAPSDVKRLSGRICVWSGLWQNTEIDSSATPPTTNNVLFHVLFVDNSFRSDVQVDIYEFFAHATNLVVRDQLNVSKAILLDAVNLDVSGGINFPFGAAWGRTNVQRVVNLTNSGIINIPSVAKYGTDRSAPYENIINSGTNRAGAQFVRARNFVNSGFFGSSAAPMMVDSTTNLQVGPPLSFLTNATTSFVFTNGGILIGSNGFPVTIVVTNVLTNSVGASLSSAGDLEIRARDMVVSNNTLQAGTIGRGTLILSVTNRLVDSGPDAPNLWSCTSGFEVRRRPATSDLTNTTLISSSVPGQSIRHIWPAEDKGTNVSGYANNMALARLTIDGRSNSTMRFAPASGTQAIYVDYLELLNTATNYNSTFAIDPRFTIYFANANVPVSKLDGAARGRFRWMQHFAGPLSSTNITYPSGNTYAFNIALASNTDRDDDNDGCVNADDPTPFPVPGEDTQDCPLLLARAFVPAAAGAVEPVRLAVEFERGPPPHARLTWQPRPRTTNTIEFKHEWTQSRWQVLTNVVSGDAPRPVSLRDPIARDGRMRVYRLRVSPAPVR